MRKSALLGMFLFYSVFLIAGEEKPRVLVEPLAVRGIGDEEARIVQSLILSYVASIGEVLIHPGNPEEFSLVREEEGYILNSGGGRPPDFTLSGSITQERDSHVLILVITKNRTGETVYYTSSHKTAGEMALKIRAIVESAFSGGESPLVSEPAPEFLNDRNIIGTWRGDAGIEMVRLQRGGRGIAIFSSGAQMNLAYAIENNTLKVVQNSPNTERYYHPVPYEVAKQLAAGAEPMRWELCLYEGGTVLRGIKIATAVRYERNAILELFPGSAREAEWIRTSR
jgi:hypothetical protein